LMRSSRMPFPMTELDEDSQTVLGELEQVPLTLAQLRIKCQLAESTLMRVLAGLAVSRVARTVSTRPSAQRIVGHVLGWLPSWRR
ncbi:MAG: hypothetical protein ABI040_08735, partial [Rhodoferax sp.]